ncbi:MAG: sugar transferase [Actinomycetes bacterium]
MTTLDDLRRSLTIDRVDHLPAQDWQRRYVVRILMVDLLAAVVGCGLAFLVRFHHVMDTSLEYVVVSLALPWAWLAAIFFCRAYESRFLGLGPEEFRRVFNAAAGLMVAIAVASYATKAEVARGYVLLALPVATLFTLGGRHLARRWLHRQRRYGRCMHRVLLVGHESGVLDSLTHMRRETYAGMQVVGVCLPTAEQRPDLVRRGMAVVGDFSTVAQAVTRTGADTVAVLACPELDGPALRRLAWQLEETSTDLLVAPAAMDVAGPRIHVRSVSGLPLLHLDEPELTGWRRVLKGVVDRLGAALTLLACLPVILAIAVAVRLTSEGPVLYRQRRVGRGGKEFTMLKFRTMVRDADQHRHALVPFNESEGGVLFKMRQDPRVTRVGVFLRRYSLDEMPQLLNVLSGSMSMVGPRPPLASEVALYDADMRARRLLVKPGLTGLWQISGRSDLPWDEAVRLDLRYVENWSLALDFSILARTVSAVVRGSGAY